MPAVAAIHMRSCFSEAASKPVFIRVWVEIGPDTSSSCRARVFREAAGSSFRKV